MNKKIVFIVDPRPVGYELNTSLHVVHAICDDIDIVKFSEDSTHNQQQKFHLDPFVPHFPFEFKNPVEFQSNASIQCSSSSSPPVDQPSFHRFQTLTLWLLDTLAGITVELQWSSLNVTIFSRSALGAILAARAVFVCGVVDLNVDFELELCRVFDLMRFRENEGERFFSADVL
ncbi:hypothetical protein S245_005034, partial [Arachis hypogaea]